jgi:hypothetical protein
LEELCDKNSSSGMDSKPLQKSAENLSNINKITKINVSSTQKSTASTSTLEKSVSGTKENAVQNVKLKSIDDKPEKSALPLLISFQLQDLIFF